MFRTTLLVGVLATAASALQVTTRRGALFAAAGAAAVRSEGAAAADPPATAAKLSVTLPELTAIVKEDFTARKYLVTGDLTPGVYADDAHFADSNNDFGPGLQSWIRGVKALFVSDRCKLSLTGPVVADEAKRTITFPGWRQVDVFRLPGAPHTPVFTGTTTLTLAPDANIVIDHTEVWDQAPSEIVSQLKFFDAKFDPPGFE